MCFTWLRGSSGEGAGGAGSGCEGFATAAGGVTGFGWICVTGAIGIKSGVGGDLSGFIGLAGTVLADRTPVDCPAGGITLGNDDCCSCGLVAG